MNFNLSLSSFEPNIRSLRTLIDIALASPLPSPPRLIFISSVGVLRRECFFPLCSWIFDDIVGRCRHRRTHSRTANRGKRCRRHRLQRIKMGCRETAERRCQQVVPSSCVNSGGSGQRWSFWCMEPSRMVPRPREVERAPRPPTHSSSGGEVSEYILAFGSHSLCVGRKYPGFPQVPLLRQSSRCATRTFPFYISHTHGLCHGRL